MNRKIFVALTVVLLATSNANAQFGGILGKSLGLPASGEAGGTYQSNNQIRTFISSDPHDRIDLYSRAIVKAAKMTEEKGFSHFGVTKYNCSMTLVNNVPAAKGCYVIAVMLNDGEQAESRGNRKVQYYKVSDVQMGIIERPQE